MTIEKVTKYLAYAFLVGALLFTDALVMIYGWQLFKINIYWIAGGAVAKVLLFGFLVYLLRAEPGEQEQKHRKNSERTLPMPGSEIFSTTALK